MRKGILALLFCLLAIPCARAQSSGEDVVASIEEAYRQLQYEEADRTARGALENFSEYTVSQLAEIHTFLALIAYNRGELGEARRQFLSALQLAPDLELDPVLVSPKVQTYFADLRAEAGSPDVETAPPATRYVLVRDRRADAALRSMLLPGWGQLHKGERMKGFAFGGLFAVAIGATYYAHAQRTDARDRYEGAGTVKEASRLYDSYNTWHRARNGLIQAAAAIWAASYVDALLTNAAPGRAESLSVRAAPTGFSLHVRF